jgi:hypothetical protein
MFWQQTPPDTMDYFIAGYVVFFSVMAIYLGSFIVRYRKLRQSLKMLSELADSSSHDR